MEQDRVGSWPDSPSHGLIAIYSGPQWLLSHKNSSWMTAPPTWLLPSLPFVSPPADGTGHWTESHLLSSWYLHKV